MKKQIKKTKRNMKQMKRAALTAWMLALPAVASAADGMAFFSKGVDLLQKIVYAIGAGLGVWGIVNLMEGYGNDNPGAKSQGMKQFMAGVGIVLVGLVLIPELKGFLG